MLILISVQTLLTAPVVHDDSVLYILSTTATTLVKIASVGHTSFSKFGKLLRAIFSSHPPPHFNVAITIQTCLHSLSFECPKVFVYDCNVSKKTFYIMFCKEMSCKFIFKIVFQLYDVNMICIGLKQA